MRCIFCGYFCRGGCSAVRLNNRLHRLLGVETPCETACTHFVNGQSVLALANEQSRSFGPADEERS